MEVDFDSFPPLMCVKPSKFGVHHKSQQKKIATKSSHVANLQQFSWRIHHYDQSEKKQSKKRGYWWWTEQMGWTLNTHIVFVYSMRWRQRRRWVSRFSFEQFTWERYFYVKSGTAHQKKTTLHTWRDRMNNPFFLRTFREESSSSSLPVVVVSQGTHDSSTPCGITNNAHTHTSSL